MTDQYSAWLGRTEMIEDALPTGQAALVAAMLDDVHTPLAAGDALPPLWHWFYFAPRILQAQLGRDGHQHRGEFLPPIPYPRRMFAGARFHFHRPLILGRAARREGTIRTIEQKIGRHGALAFVTTVYEYYQDSALCLTEELDLVYREAGPPVVLPAAAPLPPTPDGALSRTITPDSRLLFRFSALTFNAHRIHYDRDYVVEEGYPGLIVHGQLTALFLLELLRSTIDRPISTFSFRALAPLFDQQPIRLTAIPADGHYVLEAHGPDGVRALSAVAEMRG